MIRYICMSRACDVCPIAGGWGGLWVGGGVGGSVRGGGVGGEGAPERAYRLPPAHFFQIPLFAFPLFYVIVLCTLYSFSFQFRCIIEFDREWVPHRSICNSQSENEKDDSYSTPSPDGLFGARPFSLPPTPALAFIKWSRRQAIGV